MKDLNIEDSTQVKSEMGVVVDFVNGQSMVLIILGYLCILLY